MKKLNVLLSSCAFAVGLLPVGAAAQSNPAGGEVSVERASLSGDEIIVTARRREERLQDVPLAVAAVSGEALQRANITNALQLNRIAPGLTTAPGQGGSRALPNFAIRGLSQQELTPLADQSVSLYIGDIVAARSQGANGALFDINAVEVLRGPQGTLFGRNTTGGAIIIRPNRPTDKFEGMVGATVGNFDTFNLEAMLNLPVSDNILVRVAGTRLRDDGFVYDEILGRNVNDTKQEAARASVLLRNDDGIESLTVYDYFHENDGGTPTFINLINPAGSFNSPAARAARNYAPLEDLLAAQKARGIYRIANGSPIYTKVETHTVANTTTIPLSDSISFKNIIGYRHVEDDIYDDQDGTSNALHPQRRIDWSHQFSEEAQLLGETGRLNWIAGAYYFWERGRSKGNAAVGATDPGLIEPDDPFDYPGTAFTSTDVEAANRSYAFFAQGTYKFSDEDRGFSITAGVRYNKDKRKAIIRNRTKTGCRFTRDLDNNPATIETAVGLEQCELTASDTFSEVTYNVSLEYRFDPDHLLYVAHRHGYRTGGYGARAATEAGLRRTFRPETVDDYELGFKADWRPGGTFLRTNIAAYYADYKDIQRLLTDVTTIPQTTVTANAGKARIWGIEVETLFRPVQELELSANYAYTNAKYTQFADPFSGADLSNAPFARAPKNIYTLAARYTVPLEGDLGEVSVGANYFHTDGFNANDTYQRGFTDLEGWSLLNVDAGWRDIAGSGIDVTAFVNNLLKKKYSFLISNTFPLGYNSRTPGMPRTYGATVRVHF